MMEGRCGLTLIDEHTRESLLVRPEWRWSSAKVIEALADVMVLRVVLWPRVRRKRPAEMAG